MALPSFSLPHQACRQLWEPRGDGWSRGWAPGTVFRADLSPVYESSFSFIHSSRYLFFLSLAWMFSLKGKTGAVVGPETDQGTAQACQTHRGESRLFSCRCLQAWTQSEAASKWEMFKALSWSLIRGGISLESDGQPGGR